MANRMYEGMFLLDSNRYAREPKIVASGIARMVENLGGEVVVSRLWNEQRLAYPINGQRKGTYWLTYFRMDGPQITKLERESQLNDNVLRSLIVSVDERLADTLVQHATRGAVTTRPPQETQPEGAKVEGAEEGAKEVQPVAAGASAEAGPGPEEAAGDNA